MGAEKTHIGGLNNDIYFPVNGKSVYDNKMKYHSSWDWLMPVALKCVEIAENMQADEWVSSIQMSVASYKATIELAYKEVIEFIKWHNKNK